MDICVVDIHHYPAGYPSQACLIGSNEVIGSPQLLSKSCDFKICDFLKKSQILI